MDQPSPDSTCGLPSERYYVIHTRKNGGIRHCVVIGHEARNRKIVDICKDGEAVLSLDPANVLAYSVHPSLREANNRITHIETSMELMTAAFWIHFLAAIAAVEGAPNDDFIHPKSNAAGRYQITQVAVTDVNRIAKTLFIYPDHCKDPDTAAKIAVIYLEYYGENARDPFLLARIWNGGPRGPEKSSTLDYASRVANLFHHNQHKKAS